MATAQLRMSSVPVTGPFGPRLLNGRPNHHDGIDHAFGRGVPVSADGDGVVIESGFHRVYGWWVKLAHALVANIIDTSYHALNGPGLPKGTRVKMGDTIGHAGSSAMGSTGAHLHKALWLGGKFVNPRLYQTPGTIRAVTYGGNSASLTPIPFDNLPAPKTDTARKAASFMYSLYWTGPNPSKTQVSGRILTDYGSFWVPNPQIMGLLERRRKAALEHVSGGENMLDAEHDIINGFLRACFVSAQTGIALDAAKFNLALTEAIDALGAQLVVDLTTGEKNKSIDAATLAAAFDIATPRIVAALLKQQGEALVKAGK